MGTAERRERERENVRTAIIEAARDILSANGPTALSMRAIADRIEYSPATIYLYFKDKDELVGEVSTEAFEVLNEYVRREVAAVGETANAAEQYGAIGRAYARFALDHTAYFRVMFELPQVPHMDCPEPDAPGSLESVVATVQRGVDEGHIDSKDARRTAVLGWGLVHGLTSLYLTGHLADVAGSNEEFMELIGEAMQTFNICGAKPLPQP
jgi:AcrR family transcriptional regulator